MAQPQPDSLMQQLRIKSGSQITKIELARQALLQYFEQEDWGMVNAWLGFLATDLDSSDYATTDFDERWLLYFWTDNFSLLFAEVADFEQLKLQKWQYQNPPPEDELFQKVDAYSYRNRHELLAKLPKNFLSEEEQALASLLLQHLLREDVSSAARQQRNQLAIAFLQKYPQSRFKKYVYDYLFDEMEASRHIWGTDMLAVYGRADGALGVTITPFWGADVAITYGYARLNSALRFRIGAHNVRRVVEHRNQYIVPDSTANLFDFSFELGFDVVNQHHLRMYPTVGVGWGWLSAPTEPILGENTRFFFSSGWVSPALNFDFRPRSSKGYWQVPLRFRLGYRFQNFGKTNSEFAGNQLFVGVGIRLAGAVKTKRKI